MRLVISEDGRYLHVLDLQFVLEACKIRLGLNKMVNNIFQIPWHGFPLSLSRSGALKHASLAETATKTERKTSSEP